ncbi:MAG: DUF488 domain-containing protein [Hyphomicrobiales bacterium]|nr:MAG: DUF488 domain-containing protein [Hyphomicrobiales bacterium]
MSIKFDIFSIGHSTHSEERFRELLNGAGITAVADVRSSPYSRHLPHFSKTELQTWLKDSNVAYSYLGRELGGRPRDPRLFRNGVADYEAMAEVPSFSEGLARILKGAERYRIAMMCSEQDPLDCHRCLLVARRLSERGICTGHVLATGDVISHKEIEDRLLQLEKQASDDLFASPDERLSSAYRSRNMKVAFSDPSTDPE